MKLGEEEGIGIVGEPGGRQVVFLEGARDEASM
jgi:hypothetical protein